MATIFLNPDSYSPFKVSVIIPLYNAENYIERSILSAVNQPEVDDILVIDDGYKDNAKDIALHLSLKHPAVSVLTHKDNANLGASASRNLGILHAKNEYIAFLDADDYYLSGRFENTIKAFKSNSEVDAVYEPVGVEYSSDQAYEMFKKIKGKAKYSNTKHILSYPNTPYTGHDLFLSMINGGNDGPCTDGLTIKKSLFAKAGFFNTNLKLHQDTEMWIRLSFFGNFTHTDNHTTPVSIRTMHENNRSYTKSVESQVLLFRSLLGWAQQVNLNKELFNVILAKYQALIN